MKKETEEELRKQIHDLQVGVVAIVYAPIFTVALFGVAHYFDWL